MPGGVLVSLYRGSPSIFVKILLSSVGMPGGVLVSLYRGSPSIFVKIFLSSVADAGGSPSIFVSGGVLVSL